jgi:hypothetical protein
MKFMEGLWAVTSPKSSLLGKLIEFTVHVILEFFGLELWGIVFVNELRKRTNHKLAWWLQENWP